MKQQKALEGTPAVSRTTTSAFYCHPYLYTRGHLFHSASKVTQESRRQKRTGNGAALGAVKRMGESQRDASKPPNPCAHPCEQLRTQLTIKGVPWDQLGRDEERAQLLHQFRVGEAAPPLQGVPAQQGDALGHEETPVRCIAREKGSLEVHGLRASPCADVLHGCWGGTTITASSPNSPHTRSKPSSQNSSLQNFPCGQTELPREKKTTSSHRQLEQPGSVQGTQEGCLGFVPRLEPPCPAFPSPCPGRQFLPEEKP